MTVCLRHENRCPLSTTPDVRYRLNRLLTQTVYHDFMADLFIQFPSLFVNNNN